MIQAKFTSYINKAMKYDSYRLKNKYKSVKDREILTLNIIDSNFNEERVNLIESENLDYVEVISNGNNKSDFNEIISDRKMINALDKLTDRQREILYKCVINCNDDLDVAKEFNISIQSVNKTKRLAVNRIRKYMEVY